MACLICDHYSIEDEARIDRAGDNYRTEMDRIRRGWGYVACPPQAEDFERTGVRWDPLLNGTDNR